MSITDFPQAAEASRFFRHIFGGVRGYQALFTGQRTEEGRLEDTESRYFGYPSGASEALQYAGEQAEKGREVFFCAHLLRGERRIKANAVEVASLWGDLDGAEIPNGPLEPTAVIESSPGRFHCYWRMSDPLPPETAEGLNKRLARKIGADPSGFDLSQLLRVPSTTNNKYPDAPTVEIKALDAGRSYSPAELDKMLPETEGANQSGGRTPPSGEPPVQLNDRGLRVWRGKDPKLKDSGELDRSGSLMKIGRALFDSGANREVIEHALEERDGSLGWHKYTGRRDAGVRYSEIVDALESSGRNGHATLTIGKSRAKPGREAMDDENVSRPKIRVNGRYLREVTDDTLEAIRIANDPAEIFIRSGALVRVVEDENSTPIIQNMSMDHVKERADHVADFVRVAKQGSDWAETKVNPPEVAIKNLMARASLPFPPLEAVVESPILRPDGSICAAPGYDSKTRLYYRPAPGFECPEIPEKPTRKDVRSALDLINEAVGEFPYSDRASAANTLSLLITMLIRPAIPGLIPLGLIDAPQAGTGKSLLAEVLVKMGTGRDAEMAGAKKTDTEWEKQLTSQLIAGRTTIIIDNVEGALYAPSLARALTSKTWTDRVLGLSKMATVKQRASWIATGNNIILHGDLPRRCYWIRLDAKESRPWKREKFKHTNLRAWTADHRGELVGAALTIARAWHDAGRPKAQNVPKLGSFEEWTEIIGGILQYAGVEGFLGNLEALYDKADEGSAEWEAFLEEWRRQRGEDKITVKALAKLIDEEKSLQDALPGDLSEARDKGEGSFTRRLGKAIAKRAGTRYGDDGLHITESGSVRAGKQWSLRDSSEKCEFASFASLYTPYASKNDCNKDIQAGANTGDSASGGSETNSPNPQTCTSGGDEWEGEF